MTSATSGTSSDVVATPAPTTVQPGVFELLPPRAAVLDRLAEVLPAVGGRATTTLVMVGLRRREDGRPVSSETLDRLTTVLAAGLRGDDWLARSGPTEFVVLVPAPVPAAQALATRLVESLIAEAVPGTAACAGIAAVAPGVGATEVLRRAILCLTTARTIGPGQLITYSGAR